MVSVINKDTEEKHTFDSNCKVAYDGCHKIYICKDEEDIEEATEIGYKIHEISELEYLYNSSCPLVFISDWKLLDDYIPQCAKVEFADQKFIAKRKGEENGILSNEVRAEVL